VWFLSQRWFQADVRAERLTRTLGELMGDPDPEKSKRVTDAMLKMQKIIVADRQKAYDGR